MAYFTRLIIVFLFFIACSFKEVENADRIKNEVRTFSNPIIYSDIPDVDIIRVGSAYYMTSTTMYFSPGVPVMKSTDLAQWDIVNYVYDTLENTDDMNLLNGKNAYGQGQWASAIRYSGGTYYVSFVANNLKNTYIYKTKNIESGPWTRSVLSGIYHDMSLLFDTDGRVYMVYGGGTVHLIELNSDLSGIKSGGTNQVIIQNASILGSGLNSEGSHFYKLNGKYYLFMITWPSGQRRIELCFRANSVTGPYEGKLVLNDTLGFNNAGVAQGGIVDTPDGDWYALLFQDHESVGRIPVLVPVTWESDWPVFGVNGKVPQQLSLTTSGVKETNIYISDDFSSTTLAPAWQWNHNPDNSHWSLTARSRYLRLTAGAVSTNFTQARNTLTMRTVGPTCTGSVAIELDGMKNGDVTGLSAFQDIYGNVGVVMENGQKYVVMRKNNNGKEQEVSRVAFSGSTIHLRITFNFTNAVDQAKFYYGTDGSKWTQIGDTLNMEYKLTFFTGYRFGLFYYATQSTGGYGDFDHFYLEH